jgi:integrase/recombinase XerD
MGRGQGKQAKVISQKQEKVVLDYLKSRWSPERDRAMFLCSIKAGLRAQEIARLTWRMVLNSENEVGDCIALENTASKGNSGRTIHMNASLKDALQELYKRSDTRPDSPVFKSVRNGAMSPRTVTMWFLELYGDLGMAGCSSHSGRRTFITRAANKIIEAGGSLRDVQQLAGHTSLQTTQAYIEGNSAAKQKVVDLI